MSKKGIAKLPVNNMVHQLRGVHEQITRLFRCPRQTRPDLPCIPSPGRSRCAGTCWHRLSCRHTPIPFWKSTGRRCQNSGISQLLRRRRFLKKQDLKPLPSSLAAFPASPSPPRGSEGGFADERYLWPEMCRVIPVYRHLPQIRAIPPCGELRHPFIYEPLFLLRHIELHLNVPLSVCHGQPPFLIRVWGLAGRLGRRFKAFHALRSPPETRAPASNFDCSGKGPEQRKIRKRVLACCAC